MLVTIMKGQSDDKITICRADGTTAAAQFTKKGPVPHDAVHLIVEEVLGFTHGFWGMIAAGHDPEDIQEIAKAAGHASAKRATAPGAEILELIQAERIVEAAEAALWSGGTDVEGMRDLAEAGCRASYVPVPLLSLADAQEIMVRVCALRDDWASAAIGHQLEHRWALT
jgi:hypothetical protein